MSQPSFHDLPLATLQRLQYEFDQANFEVSSSVFADLRHTLLHLVKLTGKMATQIEQGEHASEEVNDLRVLREEVIPDLLFHGLHLANLLGFELGDEYEGRLRANLARMEKSTQELVKYMAATTREDLEEAQELIDRLRDMRTNGVSKALWPRVQAGIVRMLEVSSAEELRGILGGTDLQLTGLVANILANHSRIDGEPTYISHDEFSLVASRLRCYAASLRDNIQSAIDGRVPEPYEIQLWTQSQLR